MVGTVGASPQAAASPKPARPTAQPARTSVHAAGRGGRGDRHLTHRQWHGCLFLSIDRDLEAIGPGMRERHVEYEDGTRLDIGHTCGRLGERNVAVAAQDFRSEEHTSELQSQSNLVCRLLLEKKKQTQHVYCMGLLMTCNSFRNGGQLQNTSI